MYAIHSTLIYLVFMIKHLLLISSYVKPIIPEAHAID
jgi:hypothetical protein